MRVSIAVESSLKTTTKGDVTWKTAVYVAWESKVEEAQQLTNVYRESWMYTKGVFSVCIESLGLWSKC